MANIEITTSGTNIDVDFGDYGDGNDMPYDTRYKQADIRKVELFSDHVAVTMVSESIWYLVYTSTKTYLIIDKVETVAPTSNTDLYSKLKALM